MYYTVLSLINSFPLPSLKINNIQNTRDEGGMVTIKTLQANDSSEKSTVQLDSIL
jgi:hypothetical protein